MFPSPPSANMIQGRRGEMGFKSHSAEGDRFIHHFHHLKKQAIIAQDRFQDFVKDIGCSAWHINDGWVKKTHPDHTKLENAYQLTWVDSHAGYSHSYIPPRIGSKLIIIHNSPQLAGIQPFNMYIYTVKGLNVSTLLTGQFLLKFEELKTGIYNPETQTYQLYQPKPNVFFRFFKKLINAGR